MCLPFIKYIYNNADHNMNKAANYTNMLSQAFCISQIFTKDASYYKEKL